MHIQTALNYILEKIEYLLKNDAMKTECLHVDK